LHFLMSCIFDLDVLECLRCRSRVHILCAINPSLCAAAHNGGYVFSAVMLRRQEFPAESTKIPSGITT